MEIPKSSKLAERVFSITNDEEFRQIALDVFHFQYYNNPVYRRFCHIIGRTPGKAVAPTDIPFLPISCFKTHSVVAFEGTPELIFKSSGTTGMATSHHKVKDAAIYRESFLNGFKEFYGNIRDYCVLGLLPSYLERGDSSLIFMVNELIKRSGHQKSDFYLYNYQELAQVLQELENQGQKTLLIGVTHALIDFASVFPMSLHHTILMETGGMKGRGKELVRTEVHQILKDAFQLKEIHSEYGMTELLSQAYSKKDGVFETSGWMKIFMRYETDPLSCQPPSNKILSGVINVVDLANINSCSFIATEDMGKLYPDGSFEILGRMDNSDIRGCSLMVS